MSTGGNRVPNRAHPVVAPIASPFHIPHERRRATEAHRSAA